ncbi:hypothetical protein CEXT_287581 [Caerostris extrusa]|uniref:Uncharacterized protein n=1 Tax=Caerostris extrusa TaxID=172846 RepID=A0AAV4QA62_CAEEX|nr:hypothetical protein CEXT_287581 [Caerostris extrusa]
MRSFVFLQSPARRKVLELISPNSQVISSLLDYKSNKGTLPKSVVPYQYNDPLLHTLQHYSLLPVTHTSDVALTDDISTLCFCLLLGFYLPPFCLASGGDETNYNQHAFVGRRPARPLPPTQIAAATSVASLITTRGCAFAYCLQFGWYGGCVVPLPQRRQGNFFTGQQQF